MPKGACRYRQAPSLYHTNNAMSLFCPIGYFIIENTRRDYYEQCGRNCNVGGIINGRTKRFSAGKQEQKKRSV